MVDNIHDAIWNYFSDFSFLVLSKTGSVSDKSDRFLNYRIPSVLKILYIWTKSEQLWLSSLMLSALRAKQNPYEILYKLLVSCLFHFYPRNTLIPNSHYIIKFGLSYGLI